MRNLRSAFGTTLAIALAFSGCQATSKPPQDAAPEETNPTQDPLPEGRKLFSGRDIGEVGFVSIDGATWVYFNRHKAPATPTKSAVFDLWIASWDGTQQRQVVQNQSSNWGVAGANGSLFIMVDEQQVKSGAGQGEWVATLVRIDSHFQPTVSFDNVSTFTVNSQHDNRLLYRQVPTDSQPPGLFLWDGQNQLRLGDVANVALVDVQVADSGVAYFVLGSDQVLSRIGNLTDTVQPLHANVNRFVLRSDEKYAALSLSDAGATTTVVLDVQAGKDIPLARPSPSWWLGFADPDLFTYVQSAIADAPAEYHTLDLTTGTDTFLVLPAPMVDLAAFMPRPQSDEVLYLDSQGHGAFFGQSDHQMRRSVPVPVLTPQFSPDGQYLIYIDPQPLTEAEPNLHGPLMVQDANLVNPPHQLSTPGMTLEASQSSFFFINGPSTDGGVILVFWARIARSPFDLYFANYETGELKVVAHAIGNVTVDSQRIFGTVNMSFQGQDWVGDLVVQDLQDNGGRTLARAVLEAVQWSGLVAYVVRGGSASDRDGLWGSTLAPPGQDGGQ